jgi:DNA-binding NarL/FixJ family response regulator
MSIDVLVVDDHMLFRQGLISLLSSDPEFKVVGEASSCHEAVEKALELRPGMILMDFSLPDGNGIDATRAILQELPSCDIIFLTVHVESEPLLEAIRCGAKGYLLKSLSIDKLKRALKATQLGEAAISRSMVATVFNEFRHTEDKENPETNPLEQLSLREMDVLRALTSGASNQEIAKRLIISTNTVRRHIHNMLGKLKLENRYQLAKIAKQNGLTDLLNV